jgi:hypothetical protein
MMISFRFFTLLLVALSTLAPCHKINAPFYGFLIRDYLDRPNSQRTVTASDCCVLKKAGNRFEKGRKSF